MRTPSTRGSPITVLPRRRPSAICTSSTSALGTSMRRAPVQRRQFAVGQRRMAAAEPHLVQPLPRPREDREGAGADLGIDRARVARGDAVEEVAGGELDPVAEEPQRHVNEMTSGLADGPAAGPGRAPEPVALIRSRRRSGPQRLLAGFASRLSRRARCGAGRGSGPSSCPLAPKHLPANAALNNGDRMSGK